MESKFFQQATGCLATSDPDVFMKRAVDDMMANKELFNIRKRTKQGFRNAKESDRYLGKAPFGYSNIIDGILRNLIEINKPKALIVEKTFQDYITGIPQYLIYKTAKKLGLTLTGKMVIRTFLLIVSMQGLSRFQLFKSFRKSMLRVFTSPLFRKPSLG